MSMRMPTVLFCSDQAMPLHFAAVKASMYYPVGGADLASNYEIRSRIQCGVSGIMLIMVRPPSWILCCLVRPLMFRYSVGVGTTIEALPGILYEGTLLKPGDRTRDGKTIKIREGHHENQFFVYTTPSMRYAAPYAKVMSVVAENSHEELRI